LIMCSILEQVVHMHMCDCHSTATAFDTLDRELNAA